MRSWIILGLALCATSSFGAEELRWGSDLDLALLAAKKTHQPVFVSFRSPTCGPCMAYAKGVFPSDEFQKLAHGLILVDVNILEKPKVADKYGVKAAPELRTYSEDGKLTARIVGFDRKGTFKMLRNARRAVNKSKRGQTR